MRFAQTRQLVAEAAGAGIALTVVDGELRYAARPGALSSELRARLELSKQDLIGELSKPRFIRLPRRDDSVLLQTGMGGWWSETCINQLLANATHIVWKLRGDSCQRRFQAALETSSARHDVLTGRVVPHNGDMHLKLADAPVSILDVNSTQAIEDVVWAPFERGEVFRAFCQEISDTEIICGFVLHHFVADFQACRILAQELYTGLDATTGNLLGSGDQPLQYADYGRGMTEWLAGAAVHYRYDYWRENMRGAPRVCLPGALDASPDVTGPLQTINFRIHPPLRERLAEAAKTLETKLAILVLGAKFAALSILLRQTDLVVTMLISGRDDRVLLEFVGNTTDFVPVRLTVRPDEPFTDLLAELQVVYTRACRYRVPGSLVLARIQEMSGSTISPTFNFVNARSEAGAATAPHRAVSLSLEQISLPVPAEIGSAAWHQNHETNLFDTGRYIEGHVKYMPSRYATATVEAFVDCFMTCLEWIAENPRRAVETLAAC